VPLFAPDFANRISVLVIEARQAKRKSQRLLEEAKACVENLIEKAVKS